VLMEVRKRRAKETFSVLQKMVKGLCCDRTFSPSVGLLTCESVLLFYSYSTTILAKVL
jgi:hypothetical protein